MLKKIKKYFLLIPTLIVMLLNCVFYGQVVFSASAIDYNTLFHPFSESGLEDYYNITDSDAVMSKVHSSTGGYNYYVYALYATPGNYEKLLNGEDYTLNFTCVLFNDFSLITETDSFIYIQNGVNRICYSEFKTDFSNSHNIFSNVGVDSHYEMGFSYNKLNGTFKNRWFFAGSMLDTNYSDGNHYFYQSSNIPDFPFFYDFEAADSVLDVQVRFSPDLTDSLDRSFTDSEGNTYLRSDLSMRVNNFSNFPIQYTMVITSALVDVDNVFSYYSNDWVYSRSLDSYVDYYSDVAQKQQKSTFAHYVGSGQVDVVNFNFNQINLVQGGIYTVRVYAGRNDCGYASEFVLSSDDLAFEPYHINYSIVYESTFSVLQYDDVKYDPSNSSNGILPYNYGLSEKYTHSYNAIEKENGEIDYTAKDVYSDNDSWYNQPPVDNSLSSSASSTSSFLNFTKSFKNFFAFINYMFNFLPKDAKTLFTIGFSGLTIIALVKVLFKS